MKSLLLALLLASGIGFWNVQAVSAIKAVVVNSSANSLICYVYYLDGSFIKLSVRPHGKSRSFNSSNIDDVECF